MRMRGGDACVALVGVHLSSITLITQRQPTPLASLGICILFIMHNDATATNTSICRGGGGCGCGEGTLASPCLGYMYMGHLSQKPILTGQQPYRGDASVPKS